MVHQRITLLDSLRVAEYIGFLWSENAFILLAKDNSSELFKVLLYCEKLLLSRSVVTLWHAKSSLEDGNFFKTDKII